MQDQSNEQSPTIFEVASYFANNLPEPPSHFKLQKLCYYAEAWYWGIFNKPLTNEPFEAWVNGPVSKSLYVDLRSKNIHKFTPVTPEHVISTTSINLDLKHHLDEILRVYGKFTTIELERIIHVEVPWLHARRGLDLNDKSSRLIDTKKMMKSYKLK